MDLLQQMVFWGEEIENKGRRGNVDFNWTITFLHIKTFLDVL